MGNVVEGLPSVLEDLRRHVEVDLQASRPLLDKGHFGPLPTRAASSESPESLDELEIHIVDLVDVERVVDQQFAIRLGIHEEQDAPGVVVLAFEEEQRLESALSKQ